MEEDQVFQAIRDYLEGIEGTPAAWTAAVPLQWENEPAVRTADDAGNPTPWAIVEITGTLYGQESIGAENQASNRWDEEGQLFIHVLVPSGTGAKLARGLAKQAINLFRGTRLLEDQSLEFMEGSVGMGAPARDIGNWYRVSAEIAWRHMDA